MIVEADPVFCQNLFNRLSGEERRISCTDRLAGVKKLVRRRNIDVVVLGLATLKEEGLAILKAIKKIRPLTEVITINASGRVALSIEAMKLGAFDDFMGPFNIDSLLERIHEAGLRKKQHEKKKTLLHRCMDVMAAGAFAEAGEHEMALNFIKKRDSAHGVKKKENSNEADQNTSGG